MTRPTPLPLRVGAKQMTCSGPSWRTSASRGACAVVARPAGAIDGRPESRVVRLAENDARAVQEARALHLRGRGPARAAVGAAIGRGLSPYGRHRRPRRHRPGQRRWLSRPRCERGAGRGARRAGPRRSTATERKGAPLRASPRGARARARMRAPTRRTVSRASIRRPRAPAGPQVPKTASAPPRAAVVGCLSARSSPSQRTQVAAQPVNRAGEQVCPRSMARARPGDLPKPSATIEEAAQTSV